KTEDEVDTSDTLAKLMSYSLLEFDTTTERYRLHDLARVWAVGRMPAEAGEAARLRHAAHYRDLLAFAHALYLEGGENVLKGLALFDQEQANIEAGQRWVAASEGNELAAALCSDYAGAS